MQGGSTAHSGQCPVECLEAVSARLLRPRLHPGLIDLHDISASREQVLDLGIHRIGVVRCELLVIVIKIVLTLRRHGERSGDRHLDFARGIGAQKLHIADLYRMAASDPPYDARHNGKAAGTIGRLSRVVEIDSIERGGKTIGVALPTLLTVADNVDPGALLIANGETGGIVLCRFKLLRVDEPKVVCAHPRYLLRQPSTIDQPFGWRIRADQSGGKQHELALTRGERRRSLIASTSRTGRSGCPTCIAADTG